MKELTLEQLKNFAPDHVIAHGEIENSPDGLFMISDPVYMGKKLIWVAKAGGWHDWAIYTHWAENGLQYAMEQGDKVMTHANITKLVPCTNEAFSRYRF